MEKNKIWLTTAIVALLMGLLTSWLAPKGIAWYFDPPVNIGVNCRAATEWAMEKLLVAQIVGIFVGAIIGFIFARSGAKSTANNENKASS